MEIIEDIDILLELNERKKDYEVRERVDHFTRWNEEEFQQRFRLKKDTVRQLLSQIKEELTPQVPRRLCISPQQRLLLTLRFLATGNFYITTGDFGGIHKSTCGRIISKVIHAISNLRAEYIYLPRTAAEKHSTVLDFSSIARFPRVIGAVDCTHIKLQSPGLDIGENFRNRKGYFSLNCQMICDARCKILDIVARWPGAAHNSHIFNNSNIRMRLETGEMGDMVLLGDSRYPFRRYLLTPFDRPATEGQRLYNFAHARTRNVIERTFGILKRRFPILQIGIRTKIPLAQRIIVACAILHNLACDQNDELPEDNTTNENDENVEEINLEGPDCHMGNVTRNEIVQYFINL